MKQCVTNNRSCLTDCCHSCSHCAPTSAWAWPLFMMWLTPSPPGELTLCKVNLWALHISFANVKVPRLSVMCSENKFIHEMSGLIQRNEYTVTRWQLICLWHYTCWLRHLLEQVMTRIIKLLSLWNKSTEIYTHGYWHKEDFVALSMPTTLDSWVLSWLYGIAIARVSLIWQTLSRISGLSWSVMKHLAHLSWFWLVSRKQLENLTPVWFMSFMPFSILWQFPNALPSITRILHKPRILLIADWENARDSRFTFEEPSVTDASSWHLKKHFSGMTSTPSGNEIHFGEHCAKASRPIVLSCEPLLIFVECEWFETRVVLEAACPTFSDSLWNLHGCYWRACKSPYPNLCEIW